LTPQDFFGGKAGLTDSHDSDVLQRRRLTATLSGTPYCITVCGRKRK
jgi:hypothetical protein